MSLGAKSAHAAECIHSGHFMVSEFEAEAQDDGDVTANPVDDVALQPPVPEQKVFIESSLNNLFQCMSLAYRQKLTSPKWNRFKGVKLRWKDKIRLNNVIWRCWHMQFIMRQNSLVCQFASPLDVDTHIKPEITLLEGKYWKRRAEAVKAEYKKWRMYYKNRTLEWNTQDITDVIADVDILDWQSQADNHMLVDDDYVAFMSDTLFSTIVNNQPYAFPDTREIARGASLADFIQPSLGPLQPNIEDLMDTLEPLHDLLSTKLPPVPEENVIADDNVCRNTFPQVTMNPNIQSLNTPSYPLTSMPSQQLSLTQPIQHMPNSHSDILQSPNRQLINRDSMVTVLQPLPPNTENQQRCNETLMLSRQAQNHSYIQPNTNSQIDMNSTVMAQNQSQHMMVQPFNIMNPNMMSPNVNNQLLQQQSVIANNQDLSKQSQPYIQPQQKIYNQIPVTSFHDRNYNMPQGMHQSRSDISYHSGVSRRSSGSGGCIRERVPRQRPSPFVPANSTSFNHFNVPTSIMSSPQNLTDKPYVDHIHEQSIVPAYSNVGQNVNVTFIANIGSQTDQNLSNNTSPTVNQSIPRFKVPSPPPQLSNSAIIALPQVTPNVNNTQHRASKSENFRSNSLPIGANLATVLGNRSSRRRPRSGSCSPAPPRRAPLNTAASDPTIDPGNLLLAQLLTSKSQEISKPNAQPLTDNSNGVHPVALIRAPSALLVPKMAPTSPQLVNFSTGSPTNVPSPQSPQSPLENKEHRRAGHIHAEQKRRCNIKNGFDILQSLIPQLAQNPNAKVSKAAMLQKGAEYIKQLQAEQKQIKEEMEDLKKKIEYLDNSISNCQSLLPATGAPVPRQRSGVLKEMFDEYVCQRTNENWKFWIFSRLVEPLFVSYNNSVSQVSAEELKRSTLLWAEQHCALGELRPTVLRSLRDLCGKTDILKCPEKLPEEARNAVNRRK